MSCAAGPCRVVLVEYEHKRKLKSERLKEEHTKTSATVGAIWYMAGMASLSRVGVTGPEVIYCSALPGL
ncbi:hypothetical protein MHYP_G00279030 [Metynnis hypsauchen]